MNCHGVCDVTFIGSCVLLLVFALLCDELLLLSIDCVALKSVVHMCTCSRLYVYI